MSEFDREAEREKLREQFERDKEKRQQSERMSELLLKGATMTNKHCDTCGDPIFRHDGQEFCPTCHGPAAQQQGQQQGAERQAQDQHQQAQTQQQPDQHQPEATENGTADQQPDPQPDPTEAAQAAADVPEPTVEQPAPTRSEAGSRQPDAGSRQPDTQPVAEPDAGDALSGARASLTRSLATLAQKAEATDDLSRKREYLAAAKEAAEALDAAERVGR